MVKKDSFIGSQYFLCRMDKMKKPRAIDLFSGCGGLTLGLRQSGFKVIGAVEVDPIAINTYKSNHKSVRVWKKDIRNLPVSRLMKELRLKRGELELLASCPPCQGFSYLRTRNGSRGNRDPRNNLIHEVLRFVKVALPKTVMMENVPGIKNSTAFQEFCKKLKLLGSEVNWTIKDAAHYGVPQRRKRLILLAGRGFNIPFANEIDKYRTVRQAIGRLPKAGQSGDLIHDLPEKRSQKIVRLIRDIPKDGGSRLDLPRSRQLNCHKRCDGFKDIYGRMAWDDVAPTITSGCFNPSRGRFLHPDENRAITLREAAILQSFPRFYRFVGSTNKHTVALMIGNALPPEFIRRHAMEIRKALMTSNDQR
jgi:DNA (cytosine-5)-methyltransferase 1